MNLKSDKATEAVKRAGRTGIEIAFDGEVLAWQGKYGGNNKPNGPLAGKRVAVIAASEFSDFQAYYLVSYIGEYGGICEFLLVDWVTYKAVRPNIAGKGVRGMWDLSLDPIPVMGGDKASFYKNLKDVDSADYDAVIIMGGHSADVMVTEKSVEEFLKGASRNGAVLGSIGAGSMPLIRAGLLHGKNCTGDRTVSYMLKKIGNFSAEAVVRDGKIVTARSTADTPLFLREICRVFDPSFDDPWENTLKGKKVMMLVGEDFEDIELIVPTMELMYRGADILIGLFEPEMKSRPGLLGLKVATGNFGITIPFQEIPENRYMIKDLKEIKMSDFDLVVITGAFNPWNIVATGTTDWLIDAWCADKIVAAICHGAIPMAAADLVHGKKVTGWAAAKDSVEIMGGKFYSDDWAAAIDGRLVTGRTPPEIPEFLDAISIALLA
ncbi:DJ-1/PfpI family protein [Marispirochaeta aestuarii]|uniref:DJ-1/PfpI family protein n=1 Tax=Marispirochaeta aestuarii TaxID=1963862 RepID=UPI0029C8D0A1|nr:DJ-1/PfpI family protein [Marispirochaeta aestuarii]